MHKVWRSCSNCLTYADSKHVTLYLQNSPHIVLFYCLGIQNTIFTHTHKHTFKKKKS